MLRVVTRHYCIVIISSLAVVRTCAPIARPIIMVRYITLLMFVFLLPISHGGELQQCKPGPWGRVEYETLFLEAPEWVVEHFPMPSTQPRWSFAGGTESSVRGLLLRAGLDEKTCDRWLNDARCRNEEGAFTIFPTVEDVTGLQVNARLAIYRELAKSPLNSFHHDPVFIPGSSVVEWLRGAKLPAKTVELIRHLTYLDGDALLFSDYAVLLASARSEAEARHLVKVTTRTRTLLANLRVQEGDDLPALAHYWTAGYRRKDILPMLESMAEKPAGGRLDLAHLLPPLPRKLIYTYPTPDLAVSGRTPNCHWTSLNFFNYTPQELFLDLRLAASRVLDGYEKTKEPAAFGDLLLFLDAQGNAIHSCAFVADELVFTKNGENAAVPWILAPLGDVKQTYIRQPGIKIEVYRRRWPASS